MIVGNGLIAKAVKLCDRGDIILFASGVSNSVSPTNADFEREKKLISKYIDTNKLFIYFSTISVFDDSVNGNSYIKHKLAMEDFITKNIKNYLILRLPNIIGEKGNPNTLFPFFKKALENNSQVSIKKNAYRYLLTAQQLNSMLIQLLESTEKNRIINCVLKEPYCVKDIYMAIAQAIKIKPNYVLIEGGMRYKVTSGFSFSIETPSSLTNLIEEQVLQPQN